MTDKIIVRGEFMRIAHAFTYGETSVSEAGYTHSRYTRGIYIEPHPSGKGVNVVATDGAALALQHDTEGYAPKPVLIHGLVKRDAVALSNGILGARRFTVDDQGAACIKTSDGSVEQELPHVQQSVAEGYPSWRQLVPSQDDIELMVEGFPGYLNIAYLSILARLWDDSLANCRTVRILSTGGLEDQVILQFPWRPHLMVIVAPFLAGSGMPTTPDLFRLVEQDDDDDL